MKLHFQRQKNGSTSKKQRGFVSIEVIIVLVVVLGLLALGASKMDMLNTGGDTTEEMSNIQALYANTKGLKSSQGYGTAGTDLTSQLISLKGIPKNMSVVSGVVYNLFNGAVRGFINRDKYFFKHLADSSHKGFGKKRLLIREMPVDEGR